MTTRSIVLAVLASALAPQSWAEGYALAARAGTTGLGAELTVRLSDSFNLRLGAGGFGYDYDRSLSGIDYDLQLDLKAGTAAVDWHPGGAAFRLSGGVMLHGNELTGLATLKESATIGDHSYEPDQVGSLTAVADYDRKLAPFVTIRAGNGARGGRVFVSFELGVAFCKIGLSSTRSSPGLPQDLEIEAQQIRDDVGWLKLYPIVGVGLGLRF